MVVVVHVVVVPDVPEGGDSSPVGVVVTVVIIVLIVVIGPVITEGSDSSPVDVVVTVVVLVSIVVDDVEVIIPVVAVPVGSFQET